MPDSPVSKLAAQPCATDRECSGLAVRSGLSPIAVILLVTAVASLLFFFGLGEARLWDRDEPRNAGCAAEMMARGDWVVPIFNDELRKQKPALLYWLMMGAYRLFGVNEFSARFWSALLGVGTTMATLGIGRKLSGTQTGLTGAIVLASCVMFCVAARAATPDSVLIFCTTMAMYFYVRGIGHWKSQPVELSPWFPGHDASSRFCMLAFYLSLGLAVLAKGPVGFVLPMAIVGMFMLIQRAEHQPAATWTKRIVNSLRLFHPVHFSRTLWAMKPVTGTLIVLLIAAPWFVWVGLRTDGDFPRLFFLEENFARATSSFENHDGGLWYYPVAILIGFFPWSVFWLPVTIDLFQRRRLAGRFEAGEVFLLCWVVVQVGAFSIAQTKLPSYVTPCYPALALLTAGGLLKFARLNVDQSPGLLRLWKLAAVTLAITGVAVGVGFWFVAQKYFPGGQWLAVLGVPSVISGIAGWFLMRSPTTNDGPNSKLIMAFATGAVAFCFLMFGVGTGAVSGYQNSHAIFHTVRQLPADYRVASYGELESSWVFYAGKPIHELSLEAARLQERSSLQETSGQQPVNASQNHERKFWKPKPRVGPDQFLARFEKAVFVTTGQRAEELKKRLPEDFEIIQTADYFLQDDKIVLLGNLKSLRLDYVEVDGLPGTLEQVTEPPSIQR